MNVAQLLEMPLPGAPRRIAVAAAADDAVLASLADAAAREIALPLLVGDEAAIRRVAEACGADLSGMEIVAAADEIDAAKRAVALVRGGHADILMKGKIHTADLLRAVLDRDNGLRSGELLSHVSIIHSDYLDRTLFLTDCAIVPYPSLEQKVQLITNAVRAARGMGVETPRVALLAAVEFVNPKMPATVEAAALAAMAARGEIPGCTVDGPMAMDLALSAEAARQKGYRSPVAGIADILLFHNIEAGNSVAKTFTHATASLFGGVVMGAQVPIVMTSRSDNEHNKLYSILCALKIRQAQP